MISNLPHAGFKFEEVSEIDPSKKQVMLWNYDIYEYDYLVLSTGFSIFGTDFGVKDAIEDFEICRAHLKTLGPNEAQRFQIEVDTREASIGKAL